MGWCVRNPVLFSVSNCILGYDASTWVLFANFKNCLKLVEKFHSADISKTRWGPRDGDSGFIHMDDLIEIKEPTKKSKKKSVEQDEEQEDNDKPQNCHIIYAHWFVQVTEG